MAESPYASRPWSTSYAEGVRSRYARRHCPRWAARSRGTAREFSVPTTTASSSDEQVSRVCVDSGVRAVATASPSSCRTRRSTSSRSMPRCASARSSSSTTRCTRPANCVISSRTTAPVRHRVGQAGRHRRRVPGRPGAREDHQRRHHDRPPLREAPRAAPPGGESQGRARAAHQRAAVQASAGVGEAPHARHVVSKAPRPGSRRHRTAAVHERHHGQPQGRRPHPLEPAGQRDAGPRVGTGPSRR